MHSRGVLAVGLAAAAADAFLIPSSISIPELSNINILDLPTTTDVAFEEDSKWVGDAGRNGMIESFEMTTDSSGNVTPVLVQHTTMLRCPECEFIKDSIRLVNEEISTPKVVLTWTTSPDGRAVMLNDHQIYPPSYLRTPLLADLEAIDASGMPRRREERQLSFLTSTTTENLDDAQAHDLRFCLLAIDDQVMKDNQLCETLKFLEQDGKFALLPSGSVPEPWISSPLGDDFDPLPEGVWENIIDDEDIEDECPRGPFLANMMCRLRQAVEPQLEKANSYLFSSSSEEDDDEPKPKKECGKKLRPLFDSEALPGPSRLPFTLHGGPAKFHRFQENEMFEGEPIHHEHDHHHSKIAYVIHTVAHGIQYFVTELVVPICIGIAAGVVTSLLGLVVGSVVGYLWVKLVRGGKRGNATAIQEAREAQVIDDDDVIFDEKESLLAHAPTYTDSEPAPPQYAEKE